MHRDRIIPLYTSFFQKLEGAFALRKAINTVSVTKNRDICLDKERGNGSTEAIFITVIHLQRQTVLGVEWASGGWRTPTPDPCIQQNGSWRRFYAFKGWSGYAIPVR